LQILDCCIYCNGSVEPSSHYHSCTKNRTRIKTRNASMNLCYCYTLYTQSENSNQPILPYTQQQQQQPFYSRSSTTTRVRHSPTLTYPDWCPYLHHPHHFYTRCSSCHNHPNLSWLGTGINYAGLHNQWSGYRQTKYYLENANHCQG